VVEVTAISQVRDNRLFLSLGLFLFAFLGIPLIHVRGWGDLLGIALPFGAVALLLTGFCVILVLKIH
jgi:hypothetical protein